MKLTILATLGLFALGIAILWLGAHPYSYSFPLPSRLSFNATQAYELSRFLAKSFPRSPRALRMRQGPASWRSYASSR